MFEPRVYTATGIIIKRRSIGEADRILTLFTQDQGKIKVIAKGVRKIASRRSGHVEIFREVNVTLHRGKVLDILTEAQTKKSFDTLLNNIDKISFAYYLCELVDQLTVERVKHEDIYILLDTLLQKIADSTNNLSRGNMVVSGASVLLQILGFLSPAKILRAPEITPYVEQIIEKRLRTPGILKNLRLD